MRDWTRPEKLWYRSIRSYNSGRYRMARLWQGLNFLINRAVLPPQARVGQGLVLYHRGLGVVVHPNTHIGDHVHIVHGVTIGSVGAIGSEERVAIGDRVLLGAGAIINCRSGRTLTIGSDARVGAGAVVVDDVPPGVTVVGVPATPVRRS